MSLELYTEFFNIVNKIDYDFLNNNIILLGDFNLHFLSYYNINSIFNDNILAPYLFKFNNVLNFNNITLDLAISNYTSIIQSISNILFI